MCLEQRTIRARSRAARNISRTSSCKLVGAKDLHRGWDSGGAGHHPWTLVFLVDAAECWTTFLPPSAYPLPPPLPLWYVSPSPVSTTRLTALRSVGVSAAPLPRDLDSWTRPRRKAVQVWRSTSRWMDTRRTRESESSDHLVPHHKDDHRTALGERNNHDRRCYLLLPPPLLFLPLPLFLLPSSLFGGEEKRKTCRPRRGVEERGRGPRGLTRTNTPGFSRPPLLSLLAAHALSDSLFLLPSLSPSLSPLHPVLFYPSFFSLSSSTLFISSFYLATLLSSPLPFSASSSSTLQTGIFSPCVASTLLPRILLPSFSREPASRAFSAFPPPDGARAAASTPGIVPLSLASLLSVLLLLLLRSLRAASKRGTRMCVRGWETKRDRALRTKLGTKDETRRGRGDASILSHSFSLSFCSSVLILLLLVALEVTVLLFFFPSLFISSSYYVCR